MRDTGPRTNPSAVRHANCVLSQVEVLLGGQLRTMRSLQATLAEAASIEARRSARDEQPCDVAGVDGQGSCAARRRHATMVAMAQHVGRLEPAAWLGRRLQVVMDRPLGSLHPEHGFRYELNYGYIPGIIAPDDEELDAYVVGTEEVLAECEGVVVAVIKRYDDIEDKLVVAVDAGDWSVEAVTTAVAFQEAGWDSEVFVTASPPMTPLPPLWGAVLELAWASFLETNTPIGAVVVDADDVVVAQARSRRHVGEPGAGELAGCRIAHAEVNALAQLRTDTNCRRFRLLVSVEPCLMCIGAAIQSGIGAVHYGWVDAYAGAAGLVLDNPQVARRRMRCCGPDDTVVELVAGASVVAHCALGRSDGEHVLGPWRVRHPDLCAFVERPDVLESFRSARRAGDGLHGFVEQLIRLRG